MSEHDASTVCIAVNIEVVDKMNAAMLLTVLVEPSRGTNSL